VGEGDHVAYVSPSNKKIARILARMAVSPLFLKERYYVICPVNKTMPSSEYMNCTGWGRKALIRG
jgi:hypothetical protein